MPATPSPSGRQFVIEHGSQRATVVEVGGGLRTYAVAGEDVLDGYDESVMCPSGRGQILLPWPNRVAGGRYDDQQLALTEPAAGNAIHGLTRFATWAVADHGAAHIRMQHRLFAQPGYPHVLDLAVGYRLDDHGLTVTIEAVNAGPDPCPFGAGAHPYLRVGDGLVDDVVLTSPARTYYDSDDHGIPVGRHAVEGTEYDFRTARRVGAAQLDTAFTDLARGADGRARVALDAPDGSRRVTLWCGPEFGDLMLFTGDAIADVDRRRQAIAVEPMTCPPNAFRSGERLLVLRPGQAWQGSWGIEASFEPEKA